MAQPPRTTTPPATAGQAKPAPPEQKGPPSSEADIRKLYEENIKKERINGIYIPKDLRDAHVQLSKLAAESEGKFKALPEDQVLVKNRVLRQWIILNWSLYEGSRIGKYLRDLGLSYPEEQAELLILTWHRSLNGKDLGIKEYVEAKKALHLKEAEERRKQGKIIETQVRKREPAQDSTVNKHN